MSVGYFLRVERSLPAIQRFNGTVFLLPEKEIWLTAVSTPELTKY